MAKDSIDNAFIISVSINSDKIQLSTITGNLALRLVYFTIGNLIHKTRKQREKLIGLLLGLIPIHKRDNMDMKLDIYYIFLRFLIKHK